MRETRLLMISPSSKITPEQLVRIVHTLGRDVTVKETCYGCVMEGRPEETRGVLKEIRKVDEFGIYSKVRAYPVGDPRRCRAHHGTRPGYSQLDAEWRLLANINHAYLSLQKGEKVADLKEKKKLPVMEFKKICEVK